jgi:hypothetical protein
MAYDSLFNIHHGSKTGSTNKGEGDMLQRWVYMIVMIDYSPISSPLNLALWNLEWTLWVEN